MGAGTAGMGRAWRHFAVIILVAVMIIKGSCALSDSPHEYGDMLESRFVETMVPNCPVLMRAALAEIYWMPAMKIRCRRAIRSRPKRVRNGEMFYVLPRVKVADRSEEALIIQFLSDRKLFGAAYREVQPEYFDNMPYGSGAFVGPLVRTKDIIASAQRPGDIDLLVIPYEEDQLVLDRVLAIEVKAVRAKFARQGKSPNEFGFSQASALLELGFPYVAVAHLIISDGSPHEFWQTMIKAQILENDEVRILGPELVDPLPNNLTDRVYGRLVKSCPSTEIGLISAYVCSKLFGTESEGGHTVISPNARPALLNRVTKISTLEAVASYFEENAHWFLDNPKYDPGTATKGGT